MDLKTDTIRGEVSINELDGDATAEAPSGLASEIAIKSVHSTSAPNDGPVNTTRHCVLELETQCLVCYDIIMVEGKVNFRLDIEPTCPHVVIIPLLALRYSAQESDCQICHVFWGALTPFVKSADEDVMTRAIIMIEELTWWISVRLQSKAPGPKSRIKPRHEYRDDGSSMAIWVYEASLFTLSGDKLQSWFSRTVPQSDLIQQHTNSAASHAIMRAWLSDCLQNHDNFSKSCVRLSTRHPPNTPYLALSYCWGVYDVFSTTKDNLRVHMEGISVSKLPKTFRHALVITLALGYEYIWIDSLCIIQGDKEDFAHQSGQMGGIYSNADLVLSADLAKDVHEGFLHERTPKPFAVEIPISKRTRHQQLRHPKEGQSIGLVDLSNIEHHTAVDIETIFVNPIFIPAYVGARSPTFERAWCFQEQHLARRVIHFMEHSMYWRCRAHSRCECGTANRGSHLHRPHYSHIREPLTNYTNLEEMSAMLLNEAMKLWVDVVQEYSQRKLTNPTDRLPAIAGFASRLQSSTLGEYHAGLWEHSLPSALLWQTSIIVVMPEAHTYIGPTWSWVSSRRNIYFPFFPLTDSAKVLQVRTHLESSERYGQIRAGGIRLRSLFLKMNSVRADFGERFMFGGRRRKRQETGKFRLFLDLFQERKENTGSARETSPDWYLLVIAERPFDLLGLVLIKSYKQPGAFERVGIFSESTEPRRKWKHKVVTII
ncbi:hypothetical protein HBH92_092350 [Parastagonospora nodorum]|nr:hypothetical protein HBH92_092350 [Parastagonospora nodorum]KAH4431766.1 hypothetical protein HBH93_142310 [Parastagonospora nodorum]KAH4448964.1 hypothetical protein HBH91_130040 [Parastagonospora nodorum]KAH4504633.1 hypothetical protein HBH89_090910 [Parastagonospora nodorum]KAH4538741.1 hypothetical protein HBH86_180240 [Parastagonospora nodorum]